MDSEEKQRILAGAITPEEGEKLDWLRRRRTPRNIMKPEARRGKFLHVTRAGRMMRRGQGQYEPVKTGGRPEPQRAVTKEQARKSTRAQRAKADRVRKEAGNA